MKFNHDLTLLSTGFIYRNEYRPSNNRSWSFRPVRVCACWLWGVVFSRFLVHWGVVADYSMYDWESRDDVALFECILDDIYFVLLGT